MRALILALSLSLPVIAGAAAGEAPHDQEQRQEAVYARVGETVITMEEFEAAFRLGVRQRFYHGRIPQERLAAYREEVGQRLIDRVLMLQEARRQGIAPDEAWVAERLEGYLARYRSSRAWRGDEAALRRGLRQMLEEQSLLARLEEQVRAVTEPTDAEVRDYYQRHPELFTTPPAYRAAMILLKVAPSSPASVWRAAVEEAQRLKARLERGADFANLARIHSADASAARGGDLGWQHQGMLAPAAEAVLQALQPGEVSEPVTLLEGVALFQLQERRPAQLNPYEQVAERARALLQRERAQQAWEDFLTRLRDEGDVVIMAAGG